MTVSGSGDNPGQASGCQCACHVSKGTHRACTLDAGHGVGCGPHGVPLEQACVMSHPEPVERTDGYVCRRHYHWFGSTLSEILSLAELLVVRPGSAGEVRGGTTVEAPAPARLDVLAITERVARGGTRQERHDGFRERGEELWDEGPDMVRLRPDLASWVATVYEERGMTPPDWRPVASLRPACESCAHETCVYTRPTPGATAPIIEGGWVFRGGQWQIRDDLTSLVRVLTRETRWITQQEWVDEYAAQLEALHRAVASAAGDSKWPTPIGKCPNDGTTMFNTIGADQVTCRKCNKTWAGVHLARLRLIHEQEQAKESA